MKKLKKINAEKSVAIIFTAFIVFFFAAVVFNFTRIYIFPSKTEISKSNKNDAVRWEVLYPFDKNYSSESDEKIQEEKKEKAEFKFVSYINNLKKDFTKCCTEELFCRMKFIEIDAVFNRAVGVKLITGSNKILQMNNGYFTYYMEEIDTNYASQNLKKFSYALNKRGINFLYVQSPTKVDEYDNQFPTGFTDYENLNADKLMSALNKSNVNALDLRFLLRNEDSDWYSYFFRTDHHWKPETGAWASGKIAEYLNEKFDYDIDESIGDISNYNIDVYKDYLLGSQGRKVTLAYTSPEDFCVVYPKKQTEFSVNYYYGSTDKELHGNYKNCFINMEHLETVDCYKGHQAYGSYFYLDKAISQIHNERVKNGKRILYIGDSFSNCVVPCLACEVEYIDKLDLRHFTGSVMRYIDEFHPDTVIVNYNPKTLNDEKYSDMFTFE